MAYDKHVWIDGDQVTDEKMNRIENKLEELDKETESIVNAFGDVTKRYGASGFTNVDPTLTRLYDTVGMTAMVGTDVVDPNYKNDFDTAAPFARRKCVGHWVAGDGKAKFVVEAYEGDPDYAEDGSMGDYVAVDCPPAYVYESEDMDIRVVSSYPLPGYRPFACLETEPSSGICRTHTYLPAYALAFDDSGHAVSLPGYTNRQGDYATLLNNARTYANSEAAVFAMLEPSDVNYYEETLYDIEFATHNCQSIINGACNLTYADNIVCKFADNTHVLVTGWNNKFVEGSYVLINTYASGMQYNVSMYPTHRVISMKRTDETGAESSGGAYTYLAVEALNNTSFTVGTEYRITHRPYATGSANSVKTPSGSPVSNTDGLHPMRYRYRENVFCNQHRTVMDLFDVLVGTSDDDYTLEWYRLKDPTSWSGNPTNTTIAGDKFKKLSVVTAHENYKNGYVTRQDFDKCWPQTRIPVVVGDGSSAKYVCDYAHLVHTSVVRSVRIGGYWPSGAADGFGCAHTNNAPSIGSASFGAGLYFAQ